MNEQAQSSIANKAILARLSLSKWEGHKYDRQLSDRIIRETGAEQGTARVNKLIVPKESIEPVTQSFNRIYAYHRLVTMPWFDTGERILPTAMYFDYIARINALKHDAEEQVAQFIAAYPRLVATAPQRLNGMFKSSDFPPIERISGMFGINVAFFPIPVQDIRAEGIDAEELERINADKEAEIRRGIDGAVQDVWQRIYAVVSRMGERLKEYEERERKIARGMKDVGRTGVFRNSLVENVTDLCDILPKLNFTGDDSLNRMAHELKSKLCQYDADTLRENVNARHDVMRESDAILAKMQGVLA
jgi:hypothetical protein